ncbi:MAG: nickel pincer cofactor biosynthesis protein LarC [Candidatus Nezhaarchaeales archaeon]
MNLLIIDSRLAGVSGDMMLAALVDLTGEVDCLHRLTSIIERTVEYCEEVELKVYDVYRKGVKAKKVELKAKENLGGVTPSKFKCNVDRVLEVVDISDKAKNFVKKVVEEICEAEARIHDEGHEMFEVASVDTIFDVVGVASLLDRSRLFDSEIYATPPALGSGVVETSHGLLSVPTPITLEILRKHCFPYSNVPINYELTTPTGAALLVNLAKRVVDFYPPAKVKGVGYGAGSKDLTLIPNVLRVVSGEGSLNLESVERIVVIETTVDDVTGEIVGNVIEKLLGLGALDVVVLQGIGKKGRPVHLVKVLARLENYAEIAEALINELGTLGVRVFETPRIKVERIQKLVEIEVLGKKFEVTVKESKMPNGKLVRVKPEYEDLNRISRELGIPLRKVLEIVQKNFGSTKENISLS